MNPRFLQELTHYSAPSLPDAEDTGSRLPAPCACCKMKSMNVAAARV